MSTVSPRLRAAGLSAVCVLTLGAVPALAQDSQKHLTLQGISSATVAPSGLAFVHVGGTPSNHNDKVDGSVALGFGFGDAEQFVGGQLTAHVVSLTDDFADAGYFTLKLSRALSNNLYLGLQFDRIGAWGDAADVDFNSRIGLTWFTEVPTAGTTFPVMVTVGVGDGLRNSGEDPGVYAGIGVGINEHLATSLAYTGQGVDFGLGVKVNDQIQLAAGVEDIFGERDRREFVLSASYSFDLFRR